MVLGVGAGYHELQVRWLGADFHGRGARLDEYILAMRELWTTPLARFEGRHVAFSDVVFEPRPIQPRGPRIVIGGSGPAVFRRVAQLADGWHPVNLTPAQYAAGLTQIHALASGRPVEGSLRIRAGLDRRLETAVSLDGSVAEIRTRIGEYQAAGVEHLVVSFEDDLQTFLEDMRRFASEVCPAFRDRSAPAR